jgi:hypothetical protein
VTLNPVWAITRSSYPRGLGLVKTLYQPPGSNRRQPIVIVPAA